jgi:purine-binding chemotaxis protein CheW
MPERAKKTRPATLVEASPPSEQLRFLTFMIGPEEYAVPLERVREVTSCQGITRVPTTPAFIRGLTSLHGAAVPVVDLAQRFGAPLDVGEQQSVVVVQVLINEKPTLVGIVSDGTRRLLRVAPAEIAPPPALAALVAVEFLTGVLERDGRFVLCVDVDRLLDADESSHVAALAREATAEEAVEMQLSRSPYVTLRLGRELCALGLADLQEIVSFERVVHIPGTPPFVLGAANVRGLIVPVIDIASRYGLPSTRQIAESCLVLVPVGSDEHEAPVGLLAEAVEGLVHLGPDDLVRTPPFGTGFPGKLVKGMAPVAGGFIPVLDAHCALKPDDDSRAGSRQPGSEFSATDATI